LFLAIDSSVDIHNLPIALQMSECIPIDNYKKIYSYTKNVEQDVIEKKNREKGFGIISSFLANLGLQNTLFFSPTELSKYESELSEELDSVTIISHTLSQDSPGGALFDTVEENLSKGILYNYIFLNSSQAYGILRKIRNGHTENNREKLILEIAEESFWIFGSFANITIYEFKKGRPSEGYLRCIINSNNNTEFPIFLRVSEAFVDNIWNYVEKFRMENKILRYGDNNESKC